MDREQGPQPDEPPADESGQAPAGEANYWNTPPRHTSTRGDKVARIAVGAIVSFVGLALIYGPGNAVTILALSVICTAGVGLIPLLFVSWIVGWVVFAALEAIARARQGASSMT